MTTVSTLQCTMRQPSLWEARISIDLPGRKHMVSFPEALGCQRKASLEERCSSSYFPFGNGHFLSGEVAKPCGWVSWILTLVSSVSSSFTHWLMVHRACYHSEIRCFSKTPSSPKLTHQSTKLPPSALSSPLLHRSGHSLNPVESLLVIPFLFFIFIHVCVCICCATCM